MRENRDDVNMANFLISTSQHVYKDRYQREKKR